MGDYTPKISAGAGDPTYTTSAAVVGGDVVAFTAANTVAQAGANSALVAGIATADTNSGERVAVSRGGIQRPIAGGTIAFGDGVKSAASGRVVTWVSASDNVNLLLGFAVEAATTGNPVNVQWIR